MTFTTINNNIEYIYSTLNMRNREVIVMQVRCTNCGSCANEFFCLAQRNGHVSPRILLQLNQKCKENKRCKRIIAKDT